MRAAACMASRGSHRVPEPGSRRVPEAAPAAPLVARRSRHLGATVSFFQAVSSWHAYRDYTAVSELGHGQHGVAMLLRCSKTGAEVVAKQVAVNGMGEYELGLLEREIIILRTLNHPNIIRYQSSTARPKSVRPWQTPHRAHGHR